MSETKNNNKTKTLRWIELSDTSRPAFSEGVILLTKKDSIVTGYLEHINKTGAWYHTTGGNMNNEKEFKAWIPFSVAIAAAPESSAPPIEHFTP